MFNFQNKDENIITNKTMEEFRYLYSLYVYETSKLLYCAWLKTNGKKKHKKGKKLRHVRTMKYCNRNTRCNQPPRKKQISFSHIYIYICIIL